MYTPDALELALEAVRPITPGRLIVVFGADGDRDQGKRPMLGAVAARLADVLVVTDENPRSEDPQLIRDAVLNGVRSVRPDLHDVEECTTWRGDAVRRGVEICGPGDTVIVIVVNLSDFTQNLEPRTGLLRIVKVASK